MKALKQFPPTFWIANTMEIFERMAWYGFYALSSLYITGSRESGGLGLTSEERGVMQGIIPFLLYLFPVVTGALADKFGYKRTFFMAYLILTPGYYLLGLPDGFWGFFFAFLLVAVGAATFKPVVVGTVGHVTTSETKALGFGIFYMMVNVGGFLGPMIAGFLRIRWGWPWVFYLSALCIGCNFIWLFLFYKEPESRAHGLREDLAGEAAGEKPEKGARDVGPQLLGAVIRILPTFLAAGFLLGWKASGIALGAIAALAVLIAALLILVPAEVKRLLRKTGRDIIQVLGNPPFFIMAMGTIILIMLAGGNWISWGRCGILAAVLIAGNLIADFVLVRWIFPGGRGLLDRARAGDWRFVLYLVLLSGFWTEFNQLFLTMPEYIRDYTDTHDMLRWLAGACDVVGFTGWARDIRSSMAEGYQINPEWLVNIDALAIIFFQVLISWAIAKRKPFTVMIAGTITAGAGLALGVFGSSGWLVSIAIFVFSIGEMMASPKSQEYVARIAPASKTAMYMGYYFVSIALGNLFGGILSGQMYGRFGRDLKDPETMWLLFGALGLLTAGALWLYDRFIVRRGS